jgi:hypothetical protein
MIIRHYLIAMIGPELSKSNEVQSNTQVRYCRSKKWRGEGTHLMIWRCLRVINVQQFCASLPQWKNQTTFMQSKSFLKITQRRHFSDHSDDWVLLKNTPEPGHYHWRRVSQNYLNGLPKPPSSRMTCGSRIHSRVCCKRYSGPTSQSESKKSSPCSCPSWLTQKAQQPRDFIMPRWPEEEAPFLACVKRGTHDWGLSKSIS